MVVYGLPHAGWYDYGGLAVCAGQTTIERRPPDWELSGDVVADQKRRIIRPYRTEDESGVVRVWHRAGRAAYTFLPTWQAFTFEHARQVFRDVILANCGVYVGTRGNVVLAYLALNRSYIDRLYVDPSAQRSGWGTSLLEHAKGLHPEGLELHTHQENYAARDFYERHGFVAVKFGISPPPESAPDVAYHWRPNGTT